MAQVQIPSPRAFSFQNCFWQTANPHTYNLPAGFMMDLNAVNIDPKTGTAYGEL